MDRNEGIIRWSPNYNRDEFLHINFNYRVVQVYAATGHAKADHFDYEKLSKHNEFSHLNTYDWSPVARGLVAIGTSHGDVQLLRVDDDSNASITLPLKLQRSCQTVAFNTTGLLAVGLDRVRNDACLQIWDVNQRLADWDSKKLGLASSNLSFEPTNKLEASVSVTSVRFFEDQPQTLVAGVKNQCVRIHDLRDPNSGVISFQTRCNNNLAIDYVEPHYFASSSLDQPGFVIWDRRATSRSVCSPLYIDAIDEEGFSWGAALNKKTAIQSEKGVSIKQLRFSRERGGALGVLSTAGELQVYQTRKEFFDPGSEDDVEGSPQLLELKKSYVLDYPHFDPNHKTRPEDRIVSFDWMNIGTAHLQARVLALRANGKFEVMELPAASAGQLSQFIPWKPPHRLGDPYMTLMKFKDSVEQEANLGPLFATAAMANVPIYGPKSFKNTDVATALRAAVKKAVHAGGDPVLDLADPSNAEADTLSGGEADLRKLADLQIHDKGKVGKGKSAGIEPKFLSSREQHDDDHYATFRNLPCTKRKHEALDHVMLQRAKDGYLFGCKKNQALAHQDPWLQDAWEWVQGAEEAAADDGMISGPLDLSYLGVYTIWNNMLGEKAESRLVSSTVIPDSSQWERLISNINKRAGHPPFEGVATSKPHHRALCLAICGLAKPPREFDELLQAIINEERHTCAAALALFEGANELAVEILRNGDGELLFVAMALQMKLNALSAPDPPTMDTDKWTKGIEKYVDKAQDAYLYAIYSFITTGDWVAIAEQNTLPLRSRVGVALRNFDDNKLNAWLEKEMEETIIHGDIEGIVLAGITDNMADIFAKYIEKFMDYQTPILVMSFCYPRYITDIRCHAWRKDYQTLLNRHKEFIQRVKFDVESTKKSRDRNGIQVIKPPPRQITIRCLNCDNQAANDLSNSGSGAGHSTISAPIPETRNPLQAAGINAGLCCPKCGAHLPRCAICLEFVGVPRSDKPELSNDLQVRRMANFPAFCLKCKHVQHADHASEWFARHVECPVPECKCQCNEKAMWDHGLDE